MRQKGCTSRRLQVFRPVSNASGIKVTSSGRSMMPRAVLQEIAVDRGDSRGPVWGEGPAPVVRPGGDTALPARSGVGVISQKHSPT